jgi:hypothetical protein
MTYPAIITFEYPTDSAARLAFVNEASAAELGTETQGGTSWGRNNVHFCRFTATANGFAKMVYVDANTSSSVKVAIYGASATATTPGSVLATGSGTVANATWNSILLAVDATISSGSNYWVCVSNSATASHTYYATSTAAQKYITMTQSTYSFPAVFTDSGYTYSTNRGASVQVFGVPMQGYSEATTKSQGTYSLKGMITTTSGLNKTMTLTFT